MLCCGASCLKGLVNEPMLVNGLFQTILVTQAFGVILQVCCHHTCVHDTLEATKGISAQFYDFKKMIDKITPAKNQMRADSTASSKKSAALQVPKTVHRTKRSNNSDVGDNGETHPVNKSSSQGQKEFASKPKRVNKVIGGKQKNLKSHASEEARMPGKNSNAQQYLQELFKPIRIKVLMQDKYINFEMTSEFFKRLNESVHRAVKKIQNILSVIPVKGRLRFNRTPESICSNFWSESNVATLRPRRCAIPDTSYSGETCMHDFKLPDAHLRGYPIYRNNTTTPTEWLYRDGTGIEDTDMALYVHARNTILCKQNGLIAYATYCQVDQHHRPIAGLINYCPNYLKDHLYNKDVMYMTSLHEIFHILGFSKDLFDKFQSCEISIDKSKDNNRTLIKWICEKRRNSIGYVDGVKNIVTPAVRRETERHFGCDSVEGCPLENHIVSPVKTSSHWEGRLMQGSLMAPTISGPHLTALDRVTLSAFEDMGWYRVNYNHSEELLWGKQAGCEFLSKNACANESSEYFCHDRKSTGCHYLRMDKGACKTDKYLDGCNVFKTSPGMECWKAENGDDISGVNGEIYSTDSRCFESSLHQANLTENESGASKFHARCYEHRCTEDKVLQVRVKGSSWKTCTDNEYIVFEGYEGGVICPVSTVICRNTTKKESEEPTEPGQDQSSGTIVCGNFTVTIPGLSDRLELLSSPLVSNDSTAEFVDQVSQMIIESTNVCNDCVSDVQHKVVDKVSFVLKMQLKSTNLSASSNAVSDSGASNSNKNSKQLNVESSCANAVRDMLQSSTNGDLRLSLDGTEYVTDKIDFESPFEAVKRLKETYSRRDTSGTGLYVAAAVGSICGSALILIGVVVYLKNAINVAVSPLPATPMRADVRYHFSSGSITIAPSENGSAGRLPNVDIP